MLPGLSAVEVCHWCPFCLWSVFHDGSDPPGVEAALEAHLTDHVEEMTDAR